MDAITGSHHSEWVAHEYGFCAQVYCLCTECVQVLLVRSCRWDGRYRERVQDRLNMQKRTQKFE